MHVLLNTHLLTKREFPLSGFLVSLRSSSYPDHSATCLQVSLSYFVLILKKPLSFSIRKIPPPPQRFDSKGILNLHSNSVICLQIDQRATLLIGVALKV